MKPKYSTSFGNFVSEISSIDSKVAETDVTSDDGFGVNDARASSLPVRMEKSHHPVEVSLRFRVKHCFEYGCTYYYFFFCTESFLEQKGSNHLCKFHKSILVC